MIRILFRYLWLTLLVLVLASAYFLTETTSGLQLGLQFAATYLPGKLRIEKIHGKLFSAFSAENIRYDDDRVRLTMRSLNFQWNPSQLLNDLLDINVLQANDVDIYILPAKTKSASSFDWHTLPTLLSHFIAREVTVNHLSITDNQTTVFALDKITLQQSQSAHVLTAAGQWHHQPMEGRVALALQNRGVRIQDAYLKIANANAHITGELTNQWNLHWALVIPDLQKLLPQTQGNIFSEGDITGQRLLPSLQAVVQSNRLRYDDKLIRELRGKIQLSLQANTPSSITLSAASMKVGDSTLDKIDLGFLGQLSANDTDYVTHFDVAINKKNYSNVTVTLSKNATFSNYAEQPLYVKLKFNIPALSAFAKNIPETKNLQGKLFGTLEFNGSLAKLAATGDLNVMNGGIQIPKLGITLKNIHLHAYGTQSKQLTYKGLLESNTGSAEVMGETELSKAGFPTRLNITGKNLQIVNLPEYKIYIQPDLVVQLADQTINVTGKIVIPEAEITPKDFRTTVTLPSDVVFVGQIKITPSRLLAYAPAMQVNVSLGNKVSIHYQDFESMLRGDLIIRKTPNGMVTATGALYTLNGTYTAYHQTLKIQEGRLTYTGGMITNPGLNIKAVRQLKTVLSDNTNSFSQTGLTLYGGSQLLTVGVQILGTFDAPQISLFSDPSSLTQANILSYLVLGVPQPTSGSQKSTLMSAASALNLAGGGVSPLTSMTSQLQKSLGLSELNVESVQSFSPSLNQNNGGTVDNTSLVLGKEIAHNLYIHSSVSLFATPPVYILNVQYKLGKHWSIQSETSTIDTGADLLYSIERD